MQNSFLPPSWLHDCDRRRWGVAFALAVISMRCLLGLRSGNASLCGCCCWGTLLRTGELSPCLTRRLWRTPLWHWWLTGSLFLDLWNLILPFCPAPWPCMSQCVHTSQLRHSRRTTGRRELSHSLWHERRVMLLVLSLFMNYWHLTEKQREEACCKESKSRREKGFWTGCWKTTLYL